jgi:SAM-dependent methyltransferase
MIDQMFEILEKCPLCRSQKIGILYSARDTINRLPGEFYLSKCNHCNFCFQNPRVKKDCIDQFYPDTTSYYTAAFDLDKINLDQYRNLWGIKKGMSLLDIGCAFGKYLLIARKLGLEGEGIELNPAAALRGKNLGLKIFVTSFENFEPAKKYSLIIASMVLEHIYDFNGFLKKCLFLLNKNGKIILEIPTYSGAMLIFKNNAYPLHLPNHLYFFSKRNIELLLKRQGFRAISTCYLSYADDFKKSVALAAENSSFWLTFSRFPLLVKIVAKLYEKLAWVGFSSRMSIQAFK